MDELTLGWGFLVFLIIGAAGVFLQRGAPYFLPQRILNWPPLTTLNRLLPGTLIFLFFLVSWLTQAQDGTLKAWVLVAEIVILLLAVGLHLLLQQVLVTIIAAVILHCVVFYHGVGWFLETSFNWSP